MQFRAKVLATGKNTTGIEVPPHVVEGLGSGKKPAVRVTLNEYTYRSTVATMAGTFMLSVSAEVRKNANVQAGDEVDVDVEVDTAPREVTVPEDLAAALATEPEARAFFDELSYSNKRRVVMPIEDAKTDETRQRRVAKSVEKLRDRRV